MRCVRILAGALAALLAVPLPAQAWIAQKGGAAVTPTTQVFISNTTAGPSNAAVRYMPVMFSLSPASAETGATSIAPFPGTITSIRVKALVAVTTGTWAIKLRKNGVDTALTCSIISTTPNQMCTSTGSVSFVAGDNLTWSTNPTGGSASRFSMATIMQPSTANNTVIATGGTAVSNAIQVVGPLLSSVSGAVASRRNNTVPDGGTVDLLYVSSNAPGTPSSGKQWAYSVDKNGSTTTLTCTVLDDATTCSDLSHSFSVTGPSGATPGDDLEFQLVPTGTPTLAIMGTSVRYRPLCGDGCFPLSANTNNVLDAASTFYCPLAGGTGACSTTETNEYSVAEVFTLEKIAAKVPTAPGSGKSFVFTTRKNGSDTALTCTIANTDTGCTATGSITFAAGDLATTSIVPSGTPATSSPAVSYLAH